MSATSTEEWTIGRLLTWTADYLKRQGADSPRLDAEVLLAHARGCERLHLYTAFGELADETLRNAFRELVRQRAQGKPVAYLVGHREFYSLSFQVTPAVLIPRPETEFAVVEVLDRIKQLAAVPQRDPPAEEQNADEENTGQEPTSDQARVTVDNTHVDNANVDNANVDNACVEIADVGTGSGAIAVTLAKHAPQARITAIDLSPDALAVAARNIAEHQVADRVELVQGDLLQSLPAERRFHVIVSNPPYVSESEYASLAKDVKDHEPRLALVGGPRGTEVIARLIAQAAEHLHPSGWFICEISPMILESVKMLIEAEPRLRLVGVTKDLAGHARVITAQRLS